MFYNSTAHARQWHWPIILYQVCITQWRMVQCWLWASPVGGLRLRVTDWRYKSKTWARSSVSSWNMRQGSSAGMLALLTLMFLRSFSMPGECISRFGMSGYSSPSGCGIGALPSWVNTSWNCLFRMSALSLFFSMEDPIELERWYFVFLTFWFYIAPDVFRVLVFEALQ